ncbi:MAG: hypothetical protein K0R92_2148 [Lachnospiraceae bacterium]|jgi:predicted metal-dependent phosphoesterase TrpH|nr:hypothetical protein [Lachnospiraceae bacterium]
MKIDFHTHGKLAKKLPFSPEYTDWLFGEAVVSGLDALCLTEHFNTTGFHEVYEYVASKYERDGDSFLTENGFRIFPGMEVDIQEGGHTLVIGELEAILELNARLESYKQKGDFLSFAQLTEWIDEYPVLFGAGHPFRKSSHIPELDRNSIMKFDFFDLNGKDLALDNEMEQQLKDFALQLNKPVLAGSDTHQSFQYGCIYNIFEHSCNSIAELKEEIENNRYHIAVADSTALQVKAAGILKRALKEIYTLGGDYVSVLIKEKED